MATSDNEVTWRATNAAMRALEVLSRIVLSGLTPWIGLQQNRFVRLGSYPEKSMSIVIRDLKSIVASHHLNNNMYSITTLTALISLGSRRGCAIGILQLDRSDREEDL